MHKILMKISTPLLVGSILALGALAFPAVSSAQDDPKQLVVFRVNSDPIDAQRKFICVDRRSNGTCRKSEWRWVNKDGKPVLSTKQTGG